MKIRRHCRLRGVTFLMTKLKALHTQETPLAIASLLSSPEPENSKDNTPFFDDATPPLRGTASGTLRSYCDTFPQSAYYTEAFRNIWRFDMALDGQVARAAYCLEKGLPGPLGTGHRYQSAPIEEVFPNLSSLQSNQIAWILQNTYPVITPSELFARAGVNDADAAPPLDENDAYAASQVALWSVFNLPALSGWVFYDCGTQIIHPKSQRLVQVVQYLYDRALAEAQALEIPLSCNTDDCRADIVQPIACLEDCGKQAMSQMQNGWLYGPLRATSHFPFTLTLVACCAADAPTIPPIFVDEKQNPLSIPASGQLFYILFQENVRANCYHLSMRVQYPDVRALAMRDIDASSAAQRLQSMGLYLIAAPLEETLEVCFCCFAPPEIPECPNPPSCPPCPTVCPECPTCPVCPMPQCPPEKPMQPCKCCPQPTCSKHIPNAHSGCLSCSQQQKNNESASQHPTRRAYGVLEICFPRGLSPNRKRHP